MPRTSIVPLLLAVVAGHKEEQRATHEKRQKEIFLRGGFIYSKAQEDLRAPPPREGRYFCCGGGLYTARSRLLTSKLIKDSAHTCASVVNDRLTSTIHD
jgi:hypothetical protein